MQKKKNIMGNKYQLHSKTIIKFTNEIILALVTLNNNNNSQH